MSSLRTALGTGGTITLDSNITISGNVPLTLVDGTTLNLNNYTLTINNIDRNNSNRLIVADGATVTIQNGTIVYKGENDSAEGKSPIRVGSMEAAASVSSTSTLNLDNVNITSADYGIAVFSKANLTVTDSNIIATSSAIATNGTIATKGGNSCGSTVTINGGQYTSIDTAAIYFPGGDTLTVTGGTFIGKSGFDIRAGTVTISNAAITANGTASDGKTENDGPTAWGIGVAIFDNSSYGDNISVSIADNVTFECTTLDIYVGQHKVKGTEETPTTFNIESNSTNSPNGNISLTVKDSFTYTVSKSTESKSIGAFAVNLTNDGFEFADKTVIGSACTLTVEGKAVIGENVTVSNDGILTSNGTITGSGIINGSSLELLNVLGGTVSGITLNLSDTENCKAIVVSTSATGNITIEDCIINGNNKSEPDSGIFVNLQNSSNVSIKKVTFNKFANATKNPLPINVDILSKTAKIKISDCTFIECNRGNNVLFDAWVDTTIGTDQNINFDCDTRVCIWSSGDNSKTFSIPNGVTFTNKSILTIDDSTSLTVNGKLIYDGVYNKIEDNTKTLDSGLIIKIKGTGSLEVKNINFKTKGLYVEGANDVTIQNCTFTNISQSPISSDTSSDFANGISLVKCKGDITIQENTISGGDVTAASTTSNPGHTRGILIMGCGDSDDTLIIKNNTISKIPFNAIQISKYYGTSQAEVEFGTIELSGNTISEWDADNDGKTSEQYGAGRAIRIELGSVTTDIKVIDNTFVKNYGPGNTDDGNVLKVTVATEGIANVTLKDNKLNNEALNSTAGYVIIPASSSGATISGAEGELYGKTVTDLSTDLSFTKINNSDYNFKVNGTLNYVTGYEGFWSGNVAMQSGYYLPFKLVLPAGGNYTNLSMKLIGKDTKEINSFNNEITDNTISFVFFITGEFDEIKLIVDYDGSNATIKESAYIIDLSGLEFEDGVTTAPIADNVPTDTTEIPKMNISQPEDYDVETSVGNGSTILKLNAENVIYHRNANKDWGYWVGVAIPVPNGATDYTAYMGWTPYSSASTNNTSLGEMWDGTFVKDETTYISFYFNAGSTSMVDSKGYIAVDWDGATETSKPICYTVDFSDVTLGADLDVYTAPIKDNPGTETEITNLASDYAISINDINNNVVNLNLSAKDLKMHRNGNNDWGYWVGVAIEVPTGVTADNVKYGFGTNASISANTACESFDKIGTDDKNYLTFYVNAGSYVPKTYIAVDFDGTGTTYEETIYCLDISKVKFLSNDTNAVKLTFNSGYTSGPENVISYYHSGDEITLPGSDFFKRSSYSFAGWSDGAKTYAAGAEYTIPETETILTAGWSYNGGSGGGGVPITPPDVPDVPDEPTIVPDSNGNVDVVIDDKKADELVHEAVSSGSDTITILDTSDVKGNVSSVTVSTADLETISKKIENNKNIDSVSIETSKGDIIIEKEVLSSILENTDADSVSFEVEDAKNKLTEEQKKAVGDRPVYDINIKAGNENVTSFNGKTITISLPYTLKAGEDPKNIVVYYVKDDGSLEKMNCEYKDGKVIFDTDHLSKYVIGYEEQDKPVTPDTPDDEKKESSNNTIYYAVAAVIIILIIIALAYYFMKKKQ